MKKNLNETKKVTNVKVTLLTSFDGKSSRRTDAESLEDFSSLLLL